MSKKSPQNLRNIIQGIGIVCGFGLLIFQIYMGVFAYLNQSVTFRYWGFLILGLIFSMTVLIQMVIAWKLIMRDLGLKMSTLKAIRGYTLSFLPRYIPGTIWGYLSRSEWLLKNHGIPLSTSNWGSLIEVVIGISANIMIFLFWSSQWVDKGWKLIYLLAVISIPFLVWLVLRRLGTIRYRISNYLDINLDFCIVGQIRLKSWIISTLLHLLNWVYYGFLVWLCFQSLHEGIVVLKYTIIDFVGIYSISWLIGFLVLFFPSGLGVREMTMSLLLTSLLGLPVGVSSAISVFTRLITSIAELLLVTFCLRDVKTTLAKIRR